MELGTSGRAAAGERHRQRDLHRRGHRHGREHRLADPAAEISHRVASVQPRLPPWWWDEAGRDELAPPLEGEVTADVCIVGGGFTGLWTALAVREREPSARVVVVEAEHCGAGPSGRNGGFVHGYWASLAETREALGAEAALTLARAGERIVPAVLHRTRRSKRRSSPPTSSAFRTRRSRCTPTRWPGAFARPCSGAVCSSATAPRCSLPASSVRFGVPCGTRV
ncbi:MAG: FAD-dependent oxidoreductase [Actinobacteria bacterium]|nr:MAG: FAD-dependent oxidoreductase [Actinomycetota bacterium]